MVDGKWLDYEVIGRFFYDQSQNNNGQGYGFTTLRQLAERPGIERVCIFFRCAEYAGWIKRGVFFCTELQGA